MLPCALSNDYHGLFGLGLVSDRLFITALPFRRWMFFALAAGFLAFHNLHTAIVYTRNF